MKTKIFEIEIECENPMKEGKTYRKTISVRSKHLQGAIRQLFQTEDFLDIKRIGI